MSDNNISLYATGVPITAAPTTAAPTTAPTAAPTMTPTAAPTMTTIYPQHYSPLRLKVSVGNKSAYFSAYNLPPSLPINGYMEYIDKSNGIQYTDNIYPISRDTNLSQNVNHTVSTIFDINSNDIKFSSLQPTCFYLDFSGFNKVSYNSNYTFSYYRATYFFKEYSQQGINPYDYIPNILPSEVMMKNINWVNNDCTHRNYIGIGNLYQYLFDIDTLKDSNNGTTLQNSWFNFLNDTGNTLANNPAWQKDTVGGESTCAPVSWTDQKSFMHFTKDKMYFNGFQYLWNASKFDRTNSTLADYYSKANNTAWLSEIEFHNADLDGRFNREKYFLVYDTMPQQFKIKNTLLSYVTPQWVDSNGSFRDTKPFQFTADKGVDILDNIYLKLELTHPVQDLPNANYNIYTFETQNITISPDDSKLDFRTHDFRLNTNDTTYLDSTNLIQFKEYGINYNTYFGTIINNTSCGHSTLNLYLNRYSNTGRNDFSNYGNTLFPIKYKLNGTDLTYYVSYVDYKIQCDIVNQYTHRKIISYSGKVDIISDKFNSRNSPNIYGITYSGAGKEQYCSLRFTDGYDSAKQTYLVISSINPRISINIAHNTQKIFFNYNWHEYNAKEKDGFIKNKSTVYSKIETDFTGALIDDVFAESPELPSKHIKYVYVDGAWSYLEYVTYAEGVYDDTFYNTSITIDLENVNHYSQPGSDAGVYCWVDRIGKKANVTIDSTNNKIIVKNINWYDADSHLQDIIINFQEVTVAPQQEDKYIEYHFGKNTLNDINMPVNYNSAIISSNNTNIGYLLTDGKSKSPVITLLVDKNNILSNNVYINTGFYTDIYGSDNSIKAGVYIYKPNNINNITKLTYYNDYNCETASTLKFNGADSPSEQLLSDGGKKITVTNNISNTDIKNITYLNAYLLFNSDTCVNILPNEYMTTTLLTYYQTSCKNSSGNTILFVDNVSSYDIHLPAGKIFSNDLTLYTKYFPNGSNINCLYYPLIDNPNETHKSSVNQTFTLSSNTITLNNIVINNNLGNNDIAYKVHNLRTISFNTTTTPLKFTISAYMTSIGEVDYGYIYNGSIQPTINLADENSSYIGMNYNNELIDNRFMLMDKPIPLYDITHETLKYIAKKYKCDYYNYPYTAPVGIDVYFHPYYTELGTIAPGRFDCTHWYSKSYDSVITKHYIYDIPVGIKYDNLKELPITNIQYVIKNDTVSNVTINGINYKQGDNIYIKPSIENSLSVWDLVNASIGDTDIKYNSFRDYIETEYSQNNKMLSASIDEIKVDENNYSMSINNKWLNKETGGIEFNLSNIKDISDFTRKYNIASEYNLANINLSDIITINNKNLIYLEPVYLGFDNERFDIFNTTSTNDNDKYNPKWKNLLSFIDTSTDYKLDPQLYRQMRITSFYILNFVQPNCQLLIDNDYTNISTPDDNVIWDGNANGTDELKNIYNLYLSDNKKLLTLNNKINNSTKFSYKIILSNYTFVLNCKLFKTTNTPEKDGEDISLKFTLGNSGITTEAITLDKNNTINFGVFYITDEQLANIRFNQTGYLFFDPISDNPTDNYEVRITFWDENQVEIQTTEAGTIVIENGHQKKWNLLEYISNNINKDKKVNYISIKYIRINNNEDIEKYILKPIV